MVKTNYYPFSPVTKEVVRVEIDMEKTRQRFRECRLRSGLTLNEVATEAGWSISYQSTLERGKAPWSVAIIERLSDALKTLQDQGRLPKRRMRRRPNGRR